MNILVVEDDKGLLDQLETTLKRKHYGVDVADNGEKALDKIFDLPYDLVLLDIMLPRLDGLSVLKEVRKAGLDMPILMLTARSDVQDRVKGLDYGADDYLAKPFSMAELMARIRAMLRRKGNRNPVLEAGPICLDTVTRAVTLNGLAVHLTVKEFFNSGVSFCTTRAVWSPGSIWPNTYGEKSLIRFPCPTTWMCILKI